MKGACDKSQITESPLDGAGTFFYNRIWYRKWMYNLSKAITE